MAVNEISKPAPIPLVVLQSLARTATRIKNSPLPGANPSPAAVVALENLNSALADAALLNELQPLFTTINLTESQNPEVLAALLSNQTNPDVVDIVAKQNLNPQVLAAILSNEINPNLARVIESQLTNSTSPEVAATQNLISAQAEAILSKETLPVSASGQMPGTVAANTATGVAQAQTTAAGAATENLPTAAPAVAPAPPAPGSIAATPLVAAPLAAPTSTQATVMPNRNLLANPNPYAIPVYLVRDPNPPPAEPAPAAADVLPAMPIASLLALGRLILRREWEQEKREEHPKNSANPALPTERSIQLLMEKVNEHMAARGIPLRLVLARDDQDYSVDIYDCSDKEMCRIVQDILLNLEELPTLLANLQQESGILVDTKT